MSDLRVSPVAIPDFAADAGTQGTSLNARLVGNADLMAQPRLEKFLGEVHGETVRLKLHDVVIDVRTLKFVNSSCLKGFVSWLCAVQDLPSDARYRITFLTSPTLAWQRRTLRALRCFATDLVTVQA